MRNWFRYGIASGVIVTYLLLLPLVGSFAVYTAKEALRTGYGIWVPILLFGGLGFLLFCGMIGLAIFFSKPLFAFLTGAFMTKAWFATKVTKKVVVAVTPDHVKQKGIDTAQEWGFPVLVSAGGTILTIIATGFLSRYTYLLVYNPSIWSFIFAVTALGVLLISNYLILNVLEIIQDVLDWWDRRNATP